LWQLPRAARHRRVEPGLEPAVHCRLRRRGHQHHSLIHRPGWAGARGSLSVQDEFCRCCLYDERDGGVHDLFTIAGRANAPGCTQAQPNFAQAIAAGNIIYRIPTPLFGAGLIEIIPEAVIYANLAANGSLNARLGITGHTNNSGNDGTITRFGWKAQNKSVLNVCRRSLQRRDGGNQ
jgi:hypothetical protein